LETAQKVLSRKTQPREGVTFALIILGGAHDLTASLRGAYGGTCEYLRITTTGYRELAGEE
jgi:hypothetical protein